MAASTNFTLAATGTTGNNTHTGVDSGPAPGPIACQFVVEAVGATPTVTFKFQGSLDGTNWYDLAYFTDASDTLSVATRTVTATGASVNFLDTVNSGRMYNKFRCVTTSNTNVTYRAELYVFTENAD